MACEKEDVTPAENAWSASLDLEAPLVSCQEAFPGWELSVTASGLPQYIDDVDFLSREVGFAAGTSGYVGKSTDGALSWTRLGGGVTNAPLHSLEVVGPDTLYAAGGRESRAGRSLPGAILIGSTDGGASFTRIRLDGIDEVLDLYFENGTTGWAVARPQSGDFPAALYRIGNAGTTWTLVDSFPDLSLRGFDEVGGRPAAVGTRGMILLAADGSAWERVDFVRPFNSAPLFNAAGDGLAFARGVSSVQDTVYRSNDGGFSWTAAPGPVPDSELAYLGDDGSVVLANYRYRIEGGDVLAPIGLHVYTSERAGQDWTLLKTNGACGLNRRLWEIVPGTLVSIGAEVFLLERN